MSESVTCCPPGSWDGPLHPSGPAPPQGSTYVLLGVDEGTENLTVYYSAPPSGNSSKKAVMVFHDVWGLLPRVLSICV